jgi:hypothetical protein
MVPGIAKKKEAYWVDWGIYLMEGNDKWAIGKTVINFEDSSLLITCL